MNKYLKQKLRDEEKRMKWKSLHFNLEKPFIIGFWIITIGSTLFLTFR